jgi:putative ATP-dependent endonuclease of OLD family
MFARAAAEIGAPKVAARLRQGAAALAKAEEPEKQKILNPLRDAVLNTAQRFGKARFAQIAAGHVAHATVLPKYLADAVDWLIEE